jgi:hypothetical protein
MSDNTSTLSSGLKGTLGKITVVVPTFRRSGPLAWVMASVLKQRFTEEQPVRKRLVILNNDRDRDPVIRTVENVVDRLGSQGWEVQLRHRDPPVSAVDNMYNGIEEFSDEGDTVFLNGDDDIFVPNSIALRAQAFVRRPSMDMLLARGAAGLFFSSGASAEDTRAYFTGIHPEPSVEEAVRPVTLADLCRIGYILISCHAYRNNARYRKIVADTRELLERLPGTSSLRLDMISQFLPIIGLRSTMVCATESLACIRGQFARDVISRRPHGGYWSAAALYLLSTTEWQKEAELEPMRQEYVAHALEEVFFSRKREDYRELARRTHLWRRAVSALGVRAVGKSLKDYTVYKLQMNAWRLRKRLRNTEGEGWAEVFAQY